MKEARSVFLIALTSLLQNFMYVVDLPYGVVGVNVVPLLAGQSRGAEAPIGGAKEVGCGRRCGFAARGRRRLGSAADWRGS